LVMPEWQSLNFPKKSLDMASLRQNSCFSKTHIAHTNMLKKIACGLVIGSAMAGASAQTDIRANSGSSAYLQDSRGIIVRSQHGSCWRSGAWSPVDAVAGCDGQLVPPVTKAIAPEIVTPPLAADAPVPATPIVPAVPVPAKRCDFAVTLESDQAFGFNKTALSPAAKKRIDQEVLSRLASCAKVEVVLVTGHTDRLGSQAYNQKLSEKRAETVAAYLKSKAATAQIETHGAGKAQPIISCNARTTRAKLVDCLAPNRRVTIEARGTAN
jgi:OOP family OmpA-OmpF porin